METLKKSNILSLYLCCLLFLTLWSIALDGYADNKSIIKIADSDTELHMVAIAAPNRPYQGDSVQVTIEVDRPGRDVALLLSSTELSVDWELAATPDTRVSVVAVVGVADQYLGKGFTTQKVFDFSNRTLQHELRISKHGCDPFSIGFREILNRFHKLTGMTPDSINTICSPPYSTPIIINKSHNYSELLSNYPEPIITDDSNKNSFCFKWDYSHFNEFTFSTGPIYYKYNEKRPFRGLSSADHRIYVPSLSTVYELGEKGLRTIQYDDKDFSAKRDESLVHKQFRSYKFKGLTYDLKHNRLLILGSQIYEYTGRLSDLKILKEFGKDQLLSFTYFQETDEFFGIVRDCATKQINLIRYTNNGTRISVRLVKGIIPHNCGNNGLEAYAVYKLADAGKSHLALLQEYRANRKVFGAHLYKIDIDSAEAKLTWHESTPILTAKNIEKLNWYLIIGTTPEQFNQAFTEEDIFLAKIKNESISFAELLTGLKSKSSVVRREVRRSFASRTTHKKYGEQITAAAPFFAAVLADASSHPDSKTICLSLLKKIGQPSVEPLVEQYKKSDGRTANKIVGLFKTFGPGAAAAVPALVDRLETALENEERISNDLIEVIETLGVIGSLAKDAIPVLRKLEKSSSNSSIKQALKKIGPDENTHFKYYLPYYIIYGLAGLVTIVFVFIICTGLYKSNRKFKDFDLYGATILMFLIAAFGNPLCIFFGYFLTGSFGFAAKAGFNTMQVEPYPYIAMLWILACLRFGFFVFLAKPLRIIFPTAKPLPETISTGKLLYHFSKNHLAQIPWLIMPYFFFLPIEGNAMGFLYAPASMIAIVINSPIVFLLNLRTIEKLKCKEKNKIQTVKPKIYYRIVIKGISDGKSPKKIISNLSRLFKTDPLKFQPLVIGHQVTVSRRAGQRKADKYRSALEKAGCIVKVEPLS